MSTLIHASGLSKRYAEKLALDKLDFEIHKGAPVALVGPNGAGKTTLFSLLCAYVFPSAGQLSILGMPAGDPRLFGKLSALPQDAQLDPRFSIIHQLCFYAQLQGLNKRLAKQEGLRVLELVGLSEAVNERPQNLSHGMRKRACIAQALIGKPQIIMLDEATAGLDPQNARSVRELVSGLSDEATFILSSHDLSELERLCTQVLHLEQGKLKEHSTRNQSLDKTRFITLQLAQQYSDVEKVIQQLPNVQKVYSSQAREYVIEYQHSEQALDVLLLKCCQQQAWQYSKLINGHTLENQIFAKS